MLRFRFQLRCIEINVKTIAKIGGRQRNRIDKKSGMVKWYILSRMLQINFVSSLGVVFFFCEGFLASDNYHFFKYKESCLGINVDLRMIKFHVHLKTEKKTGAYCILKSLNVNRNDLFVRFAI